MSSHGYEEPLAKSFPLLAFLPPSAYSNSTYNTSPVSTTSLRQLLATIRTGLNIQSSSVVNGFLQYCSVSNSSSAFATLDSVNAALNFGAIGGGGIAAAIPGTEKSLEIRAETLNKLPINAARFVRLQVVVSSSSSTTEMAAELRGSFFRYPPAVGPFQSGSSSYFSGSTSNVIYTTVGSGGQINVS
jgi:hypothetical protein